VVSINEARAAFAILPSGGQGHQEGGETAGGQRALFEPLRTSSNLALAKEKHIA
jgi:hypothetical protein